MTEQYLPPTLQLIPADLVQCQPIRWLWPGWLARGKVHIWAGAPGVAKTTAAIGVAAIISRGGQWPDGSVAAPGSVLIWSGEDDVSDTLVPRLRAAGADLSRVYCVGDVVVAGEQRSFDPAADLLTLEEVAGSVGDISLMICDPIVSAVTGDSHKNTEVRRALQPVVNLASRLDCAVIGISHYSKGSAGKDPTERVTGSIAFGALARVVVGFAKDEEDGGRLMVRSKSNIGPDGGGFKYELEQIEFDGLSASRIKWGDALEGTAKELLGDAEGSSTPRDDAAMWLEDLLIGRSVPVKEVKTESGDAGMSWRTIERAKAELGVIAERVNEGGSRGRGRWHWRLPSSNTATTNTASPTTKFGGVEKSSVHGASRGDSGSTPPNLGVGGVVLDLHGKCPRCDGEGCAHCAGGGR